VYLYSTVRHLVSSLIGYLLAVSSTTVVDNRDENRYKLFVPCTGSCVSQWLCLIYLLDFVQISFYHLSLFTLSAVEITTDGDTLEDGEVNEDAAPKGLFNINGCFINVEDTYEKLIDILDKQIQQAVGR